MAELYRRQQLAQDDSHEDEIAELRKELATLHAATDSTESGITTKKIDKEALNE